MQTQAYQEATALQLICSPLAGPTGDVEVAVLGGGFAGLATARSLQERGIASVAVLEAQTIGYGASGRNGGCVFGGYSRDAADLVSDQAHWLREKFGVTGDEIALVQLRQWLDTKRYGGALLERDASHFHPGLTPVFGQAGLLAAQASYSWAELSDALLERLT